MKTRTGWLLALLLLAAAAGAGPNFMRRAQGKLYVYYQPPDSLYAGQALRLASRMVDEMTRDLRIPSFDTLHIFIAPSRQFFRQSTQGTLPSWAQGFAVPEQRMLMVKSPRWDRPENDFGVTLSHEVLHLMLAEKIGHRQIPRWLDEGLALFYTEHAAWSVRTAFSKALFTHSVIPLRDIDQVLQFERHRAELAYQESHSAVTYLLSTYDVEALNLILDRLAAGEPIDRAFFEATGSTLTGFESEWLRAAQKEQRWFWIFDLGEYLWIFALLLFILAVILVRLRNRRKLRDWENETQADDDEGMSGDDEQYLYARDPDDPDQELPQD